VRAALDRISYNGRYRRGTLKALHDAGIRIPARLRRPVSRNTVKARRIANTVAGGLQQIVSDNSG
jgi:hypothetical protein